MRHRPRHGQGRATRSEKAEYAGPCPLPKRELQSKRGAETIVVAGNLLCREAAAKLQAHCGGGPVVEAELNALKGAGGYRVGIEPLVSTDEL